MESNFKFWCIDFIRMIEATSPSIQTTTYLNMIWELKAQKIKIINNNKVDYFGHSQWDILWKVDCWWRLKGGAI